MYTLIINYLNRSYIIPNNTSELLVDYINVIFPFYEDNVCKITSIEWSIKLKDLRPI